MRNEYYVNSKDYINRWVVSYADFVTMLLALFMVMYAIGQIDNQKLTDLQAKLQAELQKTQTFNVYSTDKLEQIFDKDITTSKSVKVLRDNRGLILRIDNNIIFDAGSSKIKPESEKTLNEIVKTLTKIDNPVIIEGHTDSTPIKNAQYPSNWELSTARATNIISFLVKTGKISPKRLCAIGYGENMPIADNTSISGRMLNRRVDIIVLEKKK